MVNRYVEKLRAFVDLEDVEIDAIERATGQPETYRARKDLVREGDQPGPVLILLEGWAFRYKVLPNGPRQITAFLMPGDTCNQGPSVVGDMDYSVRTQTDAVVARIERRAVHELMNAYPRVAHALYIAQLVDQSTLRAWIDSLGRRSSIERVAHFLLELYFRALRCGLATHGEVELPLSQVELADALNTTPVHINRVLKELRQSDVIGLRRRFLTLRDPAGLAWMSGYDEGYLPKRMQVISAKNNIGY